MDIKSTYLAILKNDLATVKQLLEAGVHPDSVVPLDKIANLSLDSLGNVTFLHIATKNNYVDICRLLLEYQASTEIVDEGGCTPLHWAVAKNYEQIVQLLLEHHANVNAVDLSQSTPLHEAIRRRLVKITELLLKHGADLNQADIFGKTALGLVADNITMKNIVLKFVDHNSDLIIKH